MKSWPTIHDKLAKYVDDNWLRETPIRAALRKETSKLAWANMQISPHQGQQMALLARLVTAKTVVEVGTFTGYSALAVAEVLPAGGKIYCCDVSKEWTDIAKRYWKKARLEKKIELTLGPATKTLDKLLKGGLAGKVDMAFIDANKNDYDAYYERCLKLVRKGGLILVDNVLWGGSVIDPRNKTDDTKAIRALNAKLKKDKRVALAIIATGDGLTAAVKL
jgi:O-methyltransferase